MGFRLEKVASTIRLVVADAIQHKLSDPRISPFSSVTRVELSSDLVYAKVFISVMGDDAEQRKTMSGLKHATGHVQTLLAKRMNIRQCPHITFQLDDTVKMVSKTIQAVDQVMGELDTSVSGEGALNELPDESPTGNVGSGDDQ